MTETIERLLNRRSNFKGRLTRIYNYIENEENHDKLYELQARQQELADLFQKYNSTQEDIEMLDKSQQHEQERASTEEKYFYYRAKLAELLKECEMNNSTRSFQSVSQPTPHAGSIINIPHLQIPTFEGKPAEWANFKTLFDGVINSHHQLTKLQKFQYLKSLLKGEPAGLISSMAVTEINYEEALSILSKRPTASVSDTPVTVGNPKQNKVFSENQCSSVDDNRVINKDNCDNTQASVMYTHTNQSQVYLSTAIIKVQQNTGDWTTCRALLDSGSQVCLITRDLANKLQLPLTDKTKYIIHGVGTSPTHSSQSTTVNIASRSSNYSSAITCVVTDQISTKLPQNYIPLDQFKIPKGYNLADPTFNIPKHIDLLLGGQLFYSLLLQGSIQLGKNRPTLINTVFGWVVTGDIELTALSLFNNTVHTANHTQTIKQETCSQTDSVPIEYYKQTVISAHISCEQSCDQLLKRFWEQEEIKSSPIQTPEHIYCEELYKTTTTRDSTGRFTVHLPIIQDKLDQLGDSYSIAQKCFITLEKRFLNNPTLHKQYSDFIDEYLELGHASYATPKPSEKSETHQDLDHIRTNTSKAFYLPHHAVIKPYSVSTKLRVVFNGSSPSSTTVSLNQALHEGPNIYTDLIDIILRLRTYKFVLSCDIVKMFRNINIADEHRNLQSILWRKHPDDELRVIRLNTITYGTRCAPYLAFRTLLELAKQDGDLYPQAAKCIQYQTFMDDVHCGANTLSDAIELCNQLISLLKRGGFQLHKWSANNPQILQNVIENKDKISSNSLIIGDQASTLGLKYEPVTDVFRVNIPTQQALTHFTKRTVLSIIAKVYDINGYLSPTILCAKLFMQQLWKQQDLSWDTPIPEHLLTEWLSFYNNLHLLNNVTIPRYCFSDIPTKVYLVGYSDASLVAYGCCIYIVAEYTNKKQTSNLVISKSRVAPVRTVTLPKLELSGATLLSKLMLKVKPALEVAVKINSVHYYTDSTIVLNWLNSPHKKHEVYVANRISQILQNSESNSWNHTRTHDNAADLLTHGVHPKDLKNLTLWWHGPSYLLSKPNEWPRSSVTTEIEAETCHIQHVSIHTSNLFSEHYNEEDINYFMNIFQRFSSFTKLQNTIAQCYRLCHIIKNKSNLKAPLTLHELKQSHNFIIKMIQASYFKREILELKSGKGTYTYCSSPLKRLSPFLDNENILRVGGRIKHANIQYNQKFPIILPNKCHVTTLIIRKFHIQLFHSGVQNTITNLRLVYWPVHARTAVKSVVYRCTVCVRYRGQTCRQKMSSLPFNRVNTMQRPFLNIACDFSGPVYIKSSNLRNAKYTKSYILILVCLATKCIHIELSNDLTTESFLACLKRFCARRGVCSTILSDNASYFHSANNELHALYKMFKDETSYSQIIDYTNSLNIKWYFTTPLASHMGGIYESCIKQTKVLLKRKLGNCRMTYDQLYTILCQIEQILNSRPICSVSDDIDGLNYLSPGHFIIGSTMLDIPEPSLLQISDNKLSTYQRITSIKQQFWKEFYKSYLSELQSRQRWFKESPNLQVGNLVLIKDENTPAMCWPIGRIVQTFPSKDDQLTRSVMVKTAKGQYLRPIHKLVLLPICNSA